MFVHSFHFLAHLPYLIRSHNDEHFFASKNFSGQTFFIGNAIIPRILLFSFCDQYSWLEIESLLLLLIQKSHSCRSHTAMHHTWWSAKFASHQDQVLCKHHCMTNCIHLPMRENALINMFFNENDIQKKWQNQTKIINWILYDISICPPEYKRACRTLNIYTISPPELEFISPAHGVQVRPPS